MKTHIYSMDKSTGIGNVSYCVQDGGVSFSSGRFIPIWAWIDQGSKSVYNDNEVCKACINSEKLGIELLGDQ
jgi:hypothetical protein